MPDRVSAAVAILSLFTTWTYGFSTDDCVFLTVSSLWRPKEQGRPAVERELELNWLPDPECDYPDRVGLFSQDPRSLQDVEGAALFWLETESYPEGYLKTNISLGRGPLPGGWVDPLHEKDRTVGSKGDHCYPYWAASFNGTNLLHTGCFKIRPTWMADHRTELSRISLEQLVIPGTHNSACYPHGNKTTPGRDSLARYILTQDADIWSQLVHGIRYLDLRIGYYANRNSTADRFWVNHDIVRIAPLVPVLRQIVRFMTSSPDEVVIIDFHRFPIGMNGQRKRHRQLISLLKKELGAMAIPPPSGSRVTTLGEVWAHKKRLVVSYADRQLGADSLWMWPPIEQMWGDAKTPTALHEYVDEVMEKPRSEPAALWAVMAELTPSPLDVLFDGSGSLRQMADSVNRNLTQWIRDVWWEKANIVACDYYQGNNVVDVAVRTSLRKALMDKMDGI